MTVKTNPTQTELAAWISGWLVRELKLPAGAALGGKPFASLGLDSVHAMMLVGDLEELLKRRLPPTLAWDHPTVEALATHLSAAPPPGAPLPAAASDTDILERLDSLSEEVIDRLLSERMKDA